MMSVLPYSADRTSSRITVFIYQQWAIKIRGDTRKAQAIPQIVELLRIDYDPTIRAAAIALRNLCVDPENRRSVGKCIRSCCAACVICSDLRIENMIKE